MEGGWNGQLRGGVRIRVRVSVGVGVGVGIGVAVERWPMRVVVAVACPAGYS